VIKRLVQLVLLASMTACTAVKPIPSENPNRMPAQEKTSMPIIRYLALGDSYTIGESVAEQERWPVQLAELIESSPQFARSIRGNEMGVDVTIIAHTGWTVKELWEGVQANLPEGTYDMVSLLIGVNDQYRGLPVDGYREDFRFMLGRAVEFAGGDSKRVVVLSIPDWGFTPFAADRDSELIRRQIDEFNAVNIEETEAMGAHYVDVTDISRTARDDIELIASDRLHPSGKMYAMWAEKTLPVALKILLAEKGE
jgi:lysophospholipase L1-like esterase